MGIKFPNLFGRKRNNPTEPQPVGASAAKMLDQHFGVENHTFYQQQVALVHKDLEFLRNIEPQKYELLTKELEDAQKARTEPMQDILNFIRDKYKENEDKGLPFLVKKVDNCKIFIMTWDDIFKNFEHKYRYLYEKLNFEKSELERDLENKENYDRADIDMLTNEIIRKTS